RHDRSQRKRIDTDRAHLREGQRQVRTKFAEKRADGITGKVDTRADAAEDADADARHSAKEKDGGSLKDRKFFSRPVRPIHRRRTHVRTRSNRSNPATPKSMFGA